MFDDSVDIKELNDRIAKCHWLSNKLDVCRSYCLPCQRVISKGNCEVVTDYFKEKNDAKKTGGRESK